MHLTRAKTHTAMSHARKGVIYIARPLSHSSSSISVIHAIRDVLKIASTAREVKLLVNEKKIKINGRVVRDVREPIHLLGILEADKRYIMTLMPTGKYALVESKGTTRVAKVVGKKMLKNGVLQINFHDGTNAIKKAKDVQVGDSAKLNNNEIIEFIKLDKGAKVFVYKGRSKGQEGKVASVHDGVLTIELEGKKVSLAGDQVVAI